MKPNVTGRNTQFSPCALFLHVLTWLIVFRDRTYLLTRSFKQICVVAPRLLNMLTEPYCAYLRPNRAEHSFLPVSVRIMALSSAAIHPKQNLQGDPFYSQLALPGSPFSDFESFPLALARNQPQCCTSLPSPQSLPQCSFNAFFPPPQKSPGVLQSWAPMPPMKSTTAVSEPQHQYTSPPRSDDECLSIVSVEPAPQEAMPIPVKSTPKNRERRYACTAPGCGKSFAKKWNLQAHERLHTGSKPFRCRVGCSSSFMWMSSLKSHERRKCPLLPESQRYCRKSSAKKSSTKSKSRTLPAPELEQLSMCISQSLRDETGNKAEEQIVNELEDILGRC